MTSRKHKNYVSLGASSFMGAVMFLILYGFRSPEPAYLAAGILCGIITILVATSSIKEVIRNYL